MSWKFNGIEVIEENTPEGAVGFVYKIIHTPTGKFYIGKKSLTYWEVWWQFKLDVLSDPQSINENLMGKFFRKDLQ